MEEYTFSFAEIAEHIAPIADMLEVCPGVVYVTQDGKPVMEILSVGILKAFHNAINELSETVTTLSTTEEAQEKQ